MDFAFTEEQQMLRDSVARLLQNKYDFDARQAALVIARRARRDSRSRNVISLLRIRLRSTGKENVKIVVSV